MNRAWTITAVLVLLLAVSIGCGKTDGGDFTIDAALSEVVQGVSEALGDAYVRMPVELDEAALTELLGLTQEDVEDYAGHFSMTMTSADCFIAIKAREGREEAVRGALEQRRAQVERMFEKYLPEPLQTAKAGQVVQRGRYVFLIMLGGKENGPQSDIAKAQTVVDGYFQPK